MIRMTYLWISLALLTAEMGSAAEPASWHQAPYRLEVGGAPLDIADAQLGGYFNDSKPSDALGHAAPEFPRQFRWLMGR